MKYSGGRHTVKYGRRRIKFDLTYSDRQYLTINVHPDMRVTVKAPLGKAPSEVVKRVMRRSAWIVKQMDNFERFQPLPAGRQYVSGETHVYLGRQYLLKVFKSNREEVKLVGRYLRVYTLQKTNRDHIGSLVCTWFDEHARLVLERRAADCVKGAHRAGLPDPEIRYRKMKKRWGSCAKSSVITLNTELVKAPVHCIDYVIMHELCHLKCKNHSPAFWRLLSRLMPDWEKRKTRLEEVII